MTEINIDSFPMLQMTNQHLERAMISRRKFLACSAGLAGGGVVSAAKASATTARTYDDAVRSTWAPFRTDGGARELIRYATLAANSHNTQPWKFTAQERRITIAPDFARRCPAVDPNDHHLFVSLGCAAENLVLAAAAAGFTATTAIESDAITIGLDPDRPVESDLFKAILRRQSTRSAYDGTPVSNEKLAALEKAGTRAGVSIMIITDKTKINGSADSWRRCLASAIASPISPCALASDSICQNRCDVRSNS